MIALLANPGGAIESFRRQPRHARGPDATECRARQAWLGFVFQDAFVGNADAVQPGAECAHPADNRIALKCADDPRDSR